MMGTEPVPDTLSNKQLTEVLAANVQTVIPTLPAKVNTEQEPQSSSNVNATVEVPTKENICPTQDQIKSDKGTTEVLKIVYVC